MKVRFHRAKLDLTSSPLSQQPTQELTQAEVNGPDSHISERFLPGGGRPLFSLSLVVWEVGRCLVGETETYLAGSPMETQDPEGPLPCRPTDGSNAPHRGAQRQPVLGGARASAQGSRQTERARGTRPGLQRQKSASACHCPAARKPSTRGDSNTSCFSLSPQGSGGWVLWPAQPRAWPCLDSAIQTASVRASGTWDRQGKGICHSVFHLCIQKKKKKKKTTMELFCLDSKSRHSHVYSHESKGL